MKKHTILKMLLPLLIIICVSCHKRAEKEAVSIVREWTGKAISGIPDANYIRCINDTIEDVTIVPAKYKILIYLSETESESCHLRLYEWKKFFKEIDSLSKQNVSKLMIVKPKNKDAFIHSLREHNFTYPVYIDERGTFNKINHLPSNALYNYFLLGQKNEVLFIGTLLTVGKYALHI